MRQTEYFRWWITDERTGKPRKTSYYMTREEAEERHPGAEPDPSSREIRNQSEDGEHAPLNTRPPEA